MTDEWDDDEAPAKCPSCDVAYVDHLGLIGTCKALLAVTAERDRLRAELADAKKHADYLSRECVDLHKAAMRAKPLCRAQAMLPDVIEP